MELIDACQRVRSRRRSALLWLTTFLAGAGALLAAEPAGAQFDCTSLDPQDHPPASKPYFMLVVDTSGSMIGCTNPSTAPDFQYPNSCPDLGGLNFNTCNLEPTRINDAKCALRQTVQAFSGEVNFGLATFPVNLSSCPAGSCTDSCTALNGACAPPGGVGFPDGVGGEFYGCQVSPFTDARTAGCTTFGGATCQSCGNLPDCSTGSPPPIKPDDWDNGGKVVVELLQDPTWDPATPASNVPELLKWFDGQCDESKELFAIGFTPLAGSLTAAHEYLAYGWSEQWQDGNYCDSGGPAILQTPIDPVQDRPCRSVNVILVTDGEETCGRDPSAAAATLLSEGVTIDGQIVPVRTHVIGFAGVDPAFVNPIAAAGGTGTALTAANEIELAQALSDIISGALQPEVCDNTDNNCNGCVDEGFVHTCNTNPTCCTWTTTTPDDLAQNGCTSPTLGERETCICNYLASIDSSNPNGDQTLLPCTTAAQASDVSRTLGLCFNPGDVCDGADNDCDGQIDENQLKCGSPLACPTAEVCDDVDNDCDGVVDNAMGSSVPFSVCPAGCQPSGGEICDGCDNDCDGVIDEDTDTVTCGFPDPPHCQGTQSCVVTTGVTPGTCLPGGGQLTACNNDTTQPEICNGADDDCNGVVDDSVTDVGDPCTPTGTEPTIGECQPGSTICQNGAEVCVGYIGPTPEICDGLDNDCDGLIDADDPDLATDDPNIGTSCGDATGECTPGTNACVGGTYVCTGGTPPQPEICDALDNDCDGITDELPLDDGPAPGEGCWDPALFPGSTCTFDGLSWDPPANATCTGLGTLVSPCRIGTLVCQGASGWACLGSQGPSPEVCDGRDNDCDGSADDNLAGTTCGTDEGECQSGSLVCTGGQEECQNEIGPQPEICDNKDNDCDGEIDEGTLPGEGIACGTDTGECTKGTIDCVGGALVCAGNIDAQPEVCDGLDNNCDGTVDNALTDVPSDRGCWQVPGSTCPLPSPATGPLTWDPPPGGTCSGLGTLTSPCVPGRLVCDPTADTWVCQGGRLPEASEVCDGVDNDCNGGVDDGNPGGGGACGSQPEILNGVGECQPGALVCVNGALECQGEVGPTPELCDNKDNDCNTFVDDNVPGEGNVCGSSTGQCSEGVTQCVNGALDCVGDTEPGDEICNGLDDDCNGTADDNLTDSPSALGTSPDCWDNPGTQCSFAGISWDPPAGANCTDLGSLESPCSLGQLTCRDSAWQCIGGQLPVPETCDGLDNNCDGVPDDGDPGGGGVCGIDTGECQQGVEQCQGGILVCTGAIDPKVEECNGLDDDCDGETDNGIELGGSCDPPYDTTRFPGNRTGGECRPGSLECDPAGTGGTVCTGGVGPEAEVCDGKDNDCDGFIDEAGPAPDGVDGSIDPFDTNDPPRRLGDSCGTDVGECAFGRLTCVNAQVVCTGGITPSVEICDCLDNDCDGDTDEDDPQAQVPLCGGAEQSCVKDGPVCQCAGPCGRGEFQCPTQTECKTLPISGNPDEEGRFCVSDPCGDCSLETVTDSAGNVLCTPGGFDPDGNRVPECVCKSLDGCRNPCFGVRCQQGLRCVPRGDFALTCQPEDSCNFFGCPDGEACNAGACVDDPCDPNPCEPDQVCRPNPDFDEPRCVGSCAGVDCAETEQCIDGACEPTGCDTACPDDQVCIPRGDAGASCAPSPCETEDGSPACSDGSYCNPLTGACGTDPCSGVKCPAGQVCLAGQCVEPPEPPTPGTGGAGGAAGTGGTGGTGGTAGAGGTGQTDGGPGAAGEGSGGEKTRRSNEVFGLATGGGGCSCETPSRGSPATPGGLALTALLLGAVIRRRRGREEGGAR